MKLALNASTIKPTPLLDKIRVAGEAGYQGIELWAVEIYEFIGRGGEVSDVEKALSDHGLEVPTVIAVRQWGDTVGREYQLVMEEARRRFELAARLGAPLVICTPPLERPGIEGLENGYRDLLQIGRETGVRAVLEYISFFPSLNNLADAAIVLDRCGDSDGVTILDSFHNWNNRTTLADIREIDLDRISHYHINDSGPHGESGSQVDSDRTMIGDGQIDLVTELSVLHDKGYNKWLSLELFSEAWWARDPSDTARVGIERMRDISDQVGFLIET
ncbi:MAG: sugar phosphate isomerase/epimerase [Verrucomicrobiota bacterium]